jgi:hypothetical protein
MRFSALSLLFLAASVKASPAPGRATDEELNALAKSIANGGAIPESNLAPVPTLNTYRPWYLAVRRYHG